jgi:hypothetical protein
MKFRGNKPPGNKAAGSELNSQPETRKTVRRIEVTVEREVVSILHRSSGMPADDLQNGPEQRGGGQNLEICTQCGQRIPFIDAAFAETSAPLPADAQAIGTPKRGLVR